MPLFAAFRRAAFGAVALAVATLAGAATPAAPASHIDPASSDGRAEIARRLEVPVEAVRPSAVAGLYEVAHGGEVVYVSADGRYVIVTCSATVEGLGEAERVMTINKEVVIRHMVILLNTAQAERAKANGAPLPVDDRPEGDARPARAGRGGPRRRPR